MLRGSCFVVLRHLSELAPNYQTGGFALNPLPDFAFANGACEHFAVARSSLPGAEVAHLIAGERGA